MQKTEGKEGFSTKMQELGFTTLLASFSTLHEGHIEDAERNVNLELAKPSWSTLSHL